MGGRAKTAASEAQSLMAMDVGAAMALLKDEEKTTEFFNKIATLRAEIAKDLEAIGTAEQIDRLLIQTRDNHKMAAEELAKAKAESTATIGSANTLRTEAEKALEDAGAEASKLIHEANLFARNEKSEAETAKKKAVTDRKAAAEEKATAEIARSEAKVLLAKMQDKLAKAKDLVAALVA